MLSCRANWASCQDLLHKRTSVGGTTQAASDGSVRSESPPGDSMTLVVGAAVAAACSEGQYGARAASSRCASAAGSASGRARGRLWPLACPGLARAWSESPGLRVTARQPASDAPTQLGLPGGGCWASPTEAARRNSAVGDEQPESQVGFVALPGAEWGAWRHTRRSEWTTEAYIPGGRRTEETLPGKPALVKHAPSQTVKRLRPTSAASRCSSERGCPLAEQAGLDSGGSDARVTTDRKAVTHTQSIDSRGKAWT